MDLSYQVLFLIVCVLGVGYFMRKSFYGTEQRVMGVFVPRPIIMGAIAFMLGLFLWIVVNILILRFG
ncbi:hypothetical protein A2866_01645 [Candidatus Roizmanbacteria bacterium RIFCSPHIGHO2_01_FULL_39_8]|uniref:Uncharacterized protein n=3 Tax=Candidatus Roizmaniibacteriota TaxID=1752723 RepID=A0A1F7GML4_9BACT|nr:MAG: hypothetical protein A2866_01645 [Candidatus Roizmanbacteria bacterium RIFCSPHIGHO2_01_FULL_39_8]OGK28017.1 MAG: hypothetical protein A3C28_02815 [Candidatus Roizmanbacteria bacterium RIFCSPHIGHO2_02_FULL_39_9]OGK36727.1 MAG: hypothetical protein A3F60_02965 [Candidatus Roizmanbacteria bacterium RIFCSPHIGHO2_12_FULL_39_8]